MTSRRPRSGFCGHIANRMKNHRLNFIHRIRKHDQQCRMTGHNMSPKMLLRALGRTLNTFIISGPLRSSITQNCPSFLFAGTSTIDYTRTYRRKTFRYYLRREYLPLRKGRRKLLPQKFTDGKTQKELKFHLSVPTKELPELYEKRFETRFKFSEFKIENNTYMFSMAHNITRKPELDSKTADVLVCLKETRDFSSKKKELLIPFRMFVEVKKCMDESFRCWWLTQEPRPLCRRHENKNLRSNTRKRLPWRKFHMKNKKELKQYEWEPEKQMEWFAKYKDVERKRKRRIERRGKDGEIMVPADQRYLDHQERVQADQTAAIAKKQEKFEAAFAEMVEGEQKKLRKSASKIDKLRNMDEEKPIATQKTTESEVAEKAVKAKEANEKVTVYKNALAKDPLEYAKLQEKKGSPGRRKIIVPLQPIMFERVIPIDPREAEYFGNVEITVRLHSHYPGMASGPMFFQIITVWGRNREEMLLKWPDFKYKSFPYVMRTLMRYHHLQLEKKVPPLLTPCMMNRLTKKRSKYLAKSGKLEGGLDLHIARRKAAQEIKDKFRKLRAKFEAAQFKQEEKVGKATQKKPEKKVQKLQKGENKGTEAAKKRINIARKVRKQIRKAVKLHVKQTPDAPNLDLRLLRRQFTEALEGKHQIAEDKKEKPQISKLMGEKPERKPSPYGALLKQQALEVEREKANKMKVSKVFRVFSALKKQSKMYKILLDQPKRKL